MKVALLLFSAFVFGASFAPGLLAQDPVSPRAQRALSLTEALQLAEGESEAVGVARADVSRAFGERRRARSGYLPQLTGSASYVRTLRSQFSVLQSDDSDTTAAEPAPQCTQFIPNPAVSITERVDSLESALACASASNPFAQFSNLPFGRENQYQVGLSLSQNLFTGGRLSGQNRAAEAGLRSAEIGLTATRAQLLLDVTQAYYDAALGDRLVSIAEQTLHRADTTFSQTRIAREVGNQSEFELLRAQVTRDNQRPVVIQRRADRDLAYYRLKQLLNFPLDEPLQLSTELGDTAMVPVQQLDELVETPGDTASEVRAPVRQASEGVTAQEGLLRVARSQRLPQLVAGSQFGRFGFPSNLSPFSTDFVSDWTVSVGLQVPLFTGGRIKGDVEVAEANVTQARLRWQQTRELAQLDARTALTQLQAAHAAWEASVGTVEQADRAYAIADVRFREGLSTQTELLDSRIQLEQAQATRARAARDLQVVKMRIVLLPALPLGTVGAGAGTGAAGASLPPVQGTPGTGSPVPTQTFPGLQQQQAAGTTGTTQVGAGSR